MSLRQRARPVAAIVFAAVTSLPGQASAGVEYRAVAVDAIAAHWPAPLRERAAEVAWCESRHRPEVVSPRNRNGTRDWGLFQINDGGTLQGLGLTRQTALDPYANSAAAYRLWQRRGWRPWTCA